MSTSEITNISFGLQKYHGIFKKLWEITKPIYTDDPKVPTAMVCTLNGEFLKLIINKEFFTNLTPPEQYFVIVHELLHLIFEHHGRFEYVKNVQIAAIAADLAVNSAIITRFGMDKAVIDPNNDYVWIEGTFDLEDHPEIDEFKSSEYYYYALEKYATEPMRYIPVHDFSNINPSDLREILRKAAGELSDKEKRILKSLLDGQHNKSPKGGEGEGTTWFVFTPTPRAKTKRWESIIVNWCARALKIKEKEQLHWHAKPRRLFFIDERLNIPTSKEFNAIVHEKDKLNVLLLQDISGSCSDYADRFYALSQSIPADKFNVNHYAFDIKIQKFDPTGLCVGGGTSFAIIEEFIQEGIANGGKYPDAIFILTDGCGDKITPDIPSRFYWLLSEGGSLDYIPSESHTFQISDFE